MPQRIGPESVAFGEWRAEVTCLVLQPPSKVLSSILGKSNLQFAGMSISLTISTASLNLRTPDSKQVCKGLGPALPRAPKPWLFGRASCFQLHRV